MQKSAKKAQKLTIKNVSNFQKYHEILQNSNILHTQSKLQGEIFKLAKFCSKRISPQNRADFFILIGKVPKLS